MINVELKISIKDWLYIVLIGAIFGFLISLFFYFLSNELKTTSTIFFSIFASLNISIFAFFLITLSNNYILPYVDKKFWYIISFGFSFCAGAIGFSFSYIIASLFNDIAIINTIQTFWIYLSIIIGLLTFLVGVILHQFISMKYKNESIKSELLDSKLKALENELNPHFLFNALNSVSELIYIDQNRAEKAVLDISNFLRNAIYKDGLISLENELNMLKTYVNIENIRFANKIKLDVNIDSKFYNIIVPKFSIQLLVENAIKHGYVSKNLNININFDESNNTIIVSNDGKVSHNIKFGTGLSNLKKRLHLLRVGRLHYTTDENKMNFIITIEKIK